MSAQRKVWVLDQRNPGPRNGGRRPSPAEARNRPGPAASVSGAPRTASRPAPWIEILSAYLLGPLSPPVLREGGGGWMWALTVPVTGLYLFLLVEQRNVIPRSGGFSILLAALGLGGILVGLTLAGWGRSIGRLGIAARTLRSRAPSLQSPMRLLTFGLLVPGLGQVLAGHPRRGGFAFWLFAMGVLSGTVVWFSGALWNWSTVRADAGTLPLLEILLMGAGFLCFLGAMTWVIQLLDGARLGGVVTSNRVRSDWVPLALVGTLLLFVGLSRPAAIAQELDAFARSAHARGYRVLPAITSVAAMKMDASRPLYALTAAGFLEDVGRPERAAAIREELDRRWSAYSDWLNRRQSLESVPLPAVEPPLDPHRWSEISALDAVPPPPKPF